MKGRFVILIAGLFLLFFRCDDYRESKTQITDKKEGIFNSNGEQIYFTRTSIRGIPISSEGKIDSDLMTCASCHGPDGKGSTIRMKMGTLKASDIRYKALTAEKHIHGEQEQESHFHERVHPPCNDETLKRAITEGVDPAGNKLYPFMPKWKMSEEDLIDLIFFLKKLG